MFESDRTFPGQINTSKKPDQNSELDETQIYVEQAKIKSTLPGEGSAHDPRIEKPIEEALRKPSQAVGIQNVGNTCYLSSILQIFFSLGSVVHSIQSFKVDFNLPKSDNQVKNKRVESGMKIIAEIQKCQAHQILSLKNYYKPLDLVDAIVTD